MHPDLDALRMDHLTHALIVEDVVRRIAPDSTVYLDSWRNFASPSGQIQRRFTPHEAAPEPKAIINFSMVLNGSTQSEMAHVLKEIQELKGDFLFILSAGNDGETLFKRSELDTSLSDLKDHIIFVGSLDPDSSPSEFSNRATSIPYIPGDRRFFDDIPSPCGLENRKIFEDNFLWTLGKDVSVRTIIPYKGLVSGTSFASPTIAGVAALIVSSDSTLSMADVHTILLESFFTDTFTTLPHIMTDQLETHQIIDEKDINRSEIIRKNRKAGRNTKVFQRAYGGKGILSARRSLIYAKIYSQFKKDYPDLPKEELLELVKKEFDEYLAKEHDTKARILQKHVRKFLKKIRRRKAQTPQKESTSP